MTAVAEAVTIREGLRRAAARLRNAGMATPDLDARVLTAHATGFGAAQLIAAGRDRLDPSAEARLRTLIDRRAAGEPVARLVGRREFWGQDFVLNEATLIPRPDSETLVEAALEAVDARMGRRAPLRIADLGTGSGCLLVALLSELPAAFAVGIDISREAVEAARENARRNGVGECAGFLVGDWLEPLAAVVDVIVTNPPYIPSGTIGGLSAEVARHEPRAALDGGPDGLGAYRALLPRVVRVLAPGGVLVMEHGPGQGEGLAALIARSGLAHQGTRHDLAGLARVAIAAARRS